MRRSLYVKDDDFRLSFLYGNYTTLTRFTEFDLERVVDEGLSPLYVSIHSTNPELRAEMLRNPRGATSLRWLRELLRAGVEVHAQVVVCPGVNDGAELETTLHDVISLYPELMTVALVPVGVSAFSLEETMRPHNADEARRVVELADKFQELDARRCSGGCRSSPATSSIWWRGSTHRPRPSSKASTRPRTALDWSPRSARVSRATSTWTSSVPGSSSRSTARPPWGYRAPRGGDDHQRPR